jgi:hypothetical protein
MADDDDDTPPLATLKESKMPDHKYVILAAPYENIFTMSIGPFDTQQAARDYIKESGSTLKELAIRVVRLAVPLDDPTDDSDLNP